MKSLHKKLGEELMLGILIIYIFSLHGLEKENVKRKKRRVSVEAMDEIKV